MKQTTIMKGIIVFSIVFYFAPVFIWWFLMVVKNDYVLSLNNSDWGAFGSFVGGVLSPVFGLLSVVFIYLSIMASDSNHRKEMNTIHKQERRNHLLILINTYNEKLNENLKEQASFVSGQVIMVYSDGTKSISHPTGSVRQALLDFDISRDKDKPFHDKYLEYMQAITANVGLCFYSLVEQIAEIEDERELKQSIDLVQAITDFHGTSAFLELSLHRMINEEVIPLFERMCEINKTVTFRQEVLSKYRKARDLKQKNI
ncbi:hypothetical protein CGI22_24325 [Vibrio parahaemolyticus]|uniref:hypothetical protein n=1 Tax=Vibrio parahaemolyticus TaxID=670 RepID=UPI00111D193B|nr:hypothetical protein [Vibrio parahaemolyticus]TOK18430.1 hypothetical protein CGI22_24325 [Vibrio parahaemolyticus]